ncbi:MAG: hypothetical protein HQ582_32130 [Planctomycetes bacterium]|nr:hypothetical protein [Planctomycetota bacterium]
MKSVSLICLLGIPAFCHTPLLAEPQIPAAVTIGFANKSDVFECLPGDEVRLEDTEHGKAMRWDVSYINKQFRVCAKEIRPGALSGMTAMTFRWRSDQKHQLWVQVNEKSGETFYKITTADRDWTRVDVRLADLTINKDKVVNGRLDVDEINKIVILDFAAIGGRAAGGRTVWFSDWKFTSHASTPRRNKPALAKKLATGKVGMTCVSRDFRETRERWLDFFARANELGVQVLSLQSGFWSKGETSPGVYDFKSWDNFFAILDEHGFEFELSKDIGGPFFREKIDAPRDIRFTSFTDPSLLNRYKRFVIAYLDRFGKRHAYIVIHAEGADAYFKQHPNQLNDYCEFLREVRKAIKQHSPHVQVGVNTDISNDDRVLARLAEVTDFMAYDVVKGKVVRKPAEFETLVERLIRVSKGKKIAFQNAGWSTSKTDDGSDQEQVEFIQEFFRVLDRNRDKIEYASFGSMYDHDTAVTGPAYRAVFPDLPPRFVDRIVDSMSHFGLFRVDGTAKPGWAELRKRVAEYYEQK